MADLSTIRKRLEKHILSSGHTFREVSLKIGRKDSYIQQYIKYGFPKRLNELDRKRICQLLDIKESELMDEDLIKNTSSEETPFSINPKQNNYTDFICIDINEPVYGKSLGENLIGQMAINYKEFYGWFHGNPYNLKIIRINSDNMEPTIQSGSLIIYDSSVMEYTGEGLYIVNYDNQICVKRLQKMSGDNYLLKSENPRYQDVRCNREEIDIIGRAINALSSRPL